MISLASLLLTALPGPQGAPPGTRAVEAVRNGDFSQRYDPDLPARPDRPEVPWWRTAAGEPELREGGVWLPAGAVLEQPIAAYGPTALGMELSPSVAEGEVQLTLAEEGGTRGFEGAWTSSPSGAGILGASIATEGGPPWTPRFLLRIRGGAEGALVRGVGLDVPLPAPGEDALRAEVAALLERVWNTWLGRSLDSVGERETAFVALDFDADTGAPSPPARRVTVHPLHTQLLDAWRLGAAAGFSEESVAAWEAFLARALDDALALGAHPATGLPRFWDPVEDRPDDERELEVAAFLRFLLDVDEHGPPALRERALEAARKLGETVLATGLRPDGTVAARYRPRDGRPGAAGVPLRRLDVPAELGRLGARLGDRRYLEAAREAFLTFEYDHYWPLAPGKIDPGFDDEYGHYGARAVTLWEAWPDEPLFRELALSGYRRYAPALRELVRSGGYVAADQVRCWRIFRDVAELEPGVREEVAAVLVEAARAHVHGQQGDAGAWLDVTMERWDPVSNLPVGDLGGMPQNLVEGLAVLLDPGLGLAPDERQEMLSWWTAVVRSSDAAYGGEHGHLVGARRETGAGAFHSAGGSLRLASGLLAGLEALAR